LQTSLFLIYVAALSVTGEFAFPNSAGKERKIQSAGDLGYMVRNGLNLSII